MQQDTSILKDKTEQQNDSLACIKVFGIGGGGSNAIDRMIAAELPIEFWVANTDRQAMERSCSPNSIQLGHKLTRGLGAGGNPSIGAKASEESRDEIADAMKGADMIFITAGMGGGTGTGSISVFAEIAKELNIINVAVVTKPFSFEGKKRLQQAQQGIDILRDKVDALIVVPNDKLLQIISKNTPMNEAFKLADGVLLNGVQGISDIITVPGLINVDFADVKTIISLSGSALMGVGHASGEGRATAAATEAISSPLLDSPIAGAKGIIFNVTGGPDLTLHEVNEAAEVIYNSLPNDDANIIIGAVIDDSLENQIKITIIATGFEGEQTPHSFPTSLSSKSSNLFSFKNSPGQRFAKIDQLDKKFAGNTHHNNIHSNTSNTHHNNSNSSSSSEHNSNLLSFSSPYSLDNNSKNNSVVPMESLLNSSEDPNKTYTPLESNSNKSLKREKIDIPSFLMDNKAD